MKCLRCDGVEMEVKVRGEGTDIVEIDLCPQCKGIWLDPEELQKLDDNFFLDIEKIDFEEVRANREDLELFCPRCETGTMLDKVHPVQFKSLVLDTCPSCKGFWLDKGELERVRNVSDQLLIASLLSLDEEG